jgi:phosphoribosylformylglycinamidine synthase
LLAEVLSRGSRRALLTSAHDLADGGLALAVVESALRHGMGARIKLPAKADPFVWLFSESTGRVLVSVKRGTERDLASLCRANEIKLTRLGEVTAEEDAILEVVGQFTLPLARIRDAWQFPLPAAMG